MTEASFMIEVRTELAITKNLATTVTCLCYDEGDLILTTFGFYSPTDSGHSMVPSFKSTTRKIDGKTHASFYCLYS